MKSEVTIKQITLIGVMTALLCITGPISIPLPLTLVPISLTTLAIFFCIYVLGWKKALVAYGVYYLLGFVGLPVFSNYSGGVGKAMGPTGGYLIGFVGLIMISGWHIERFSDNRWMHAIGMVTGMLCTYIIGTMWFMYLNQIHLWSGIAMGVLPFVVGDILKILVAIFLGPTVKKQVLPMLYHS